MLCAPVFIFTFGSPALLGRPRLGKFTFARLCLYLQDPIIFDKEAFFADFAQLPLSLIYPSDDPDEQLGTLNSLFTECLERHAPLRRCRMTRPPAPWMECGDIRALQTHTVETGLGRKRTEPIQHPPGMPSEQSRINLRLQYGMLERNSWKEHALSSSKSKEVWRVVHRVLKPNQQPLRFDPEKLNVHFASTAKRTLDTQATTADYLLQFIRNLPEPIEHTCNFSLRKVTFGEVLHAIKNTRSDCSTGPDQLPAKFIKLVAEHLAGPLTAIINSCIEKSTFPHLWKTARISPIPKIDRPESEDHL